MLLLYVCKVVRETWDTVTIFFEKPAGGFVYEAGQFLTLGVRIEGEVFYRSYSLATCPLTDELPAITVKRVAGGVVSNYLNDVVRAGSTLEAFLPQGHFTLRGEPPTKQYVFIGGGSGITPLYSMMKCVLAGGVQGQVYLIDANRTEGDIIYKEGLEVLERTYAGRCQVVHVLSQPRGDWGGMRGRLEPARVLELLAGCSAESDYFLCGPEGFRAMVRGVLMEGKGVQASRVYEESFVAPSPSEEGVAAEVTLYYQGGVYTYPVEPGTSLLDGALDEGIDIPYACGTGICDTCRAKCVEGGVKMVVEEGLAEEDKEAGYVLTCVGYATTPRVTLEVEEGG